MLNACVSCSFVMWWSRERERESAMKLCRPLMCCEYSADSFFIRVVANHLATISWPGIDSGKDALYIQPRADDESVRASGF